MRTATAAATPTEEKVAPLNGPVPCRHEYDGPPSAVVDGRVARRLRRCLDGYAHADWAWWGDRRIALDTGEPVTCAVSRSARGLCAADPWGPPSWEGVLGGDGHADVTATSHRAPAPQPRRRGFGG